MTKLQQLFDWFNDKKNCIVALSGGVDSALVAYAAYQKLQNKAIAVTADYNTLSQEELISSKKICQEIGIKQIIISYDELVNEKFVQNDNNRCYYCRQELAKNLKKIAENFGTELIVDGTNIDDLGDYRPGIQALKENQIRSPLVETEFTKKQVRHEAKFAGLAVYDKPSNSCLASRIPWGQRVTAERLARIEVGESIIKQIIGTRQVRVRDIEGNAKIEVYSQDIKLLSDSNNFKKISDKLKQIGFKSISIDPEGYRSGKLNVILD